MIEKIGFEVLPNVYFRDLEVKTFWNKQNDITDLSKTANQIIISGFVIVFDNMDSPTWSSYSDFLSLLKIRVYCSTEQDSIIFNSPSQILEFPNIKANQAIAFKITLNQEQINSFNLRENRFLIFANCFISKNEMKQKFSINIPNSFSDVQGPTSSELIYENFNKIETTFVFKNKDESISYGPNHKIQADPLSAPPDENSFMQGSFHRDGEHNPLIRTTINRNLKTSYEDVIIGENLRSKNNPYKKVGNIYDPNDRVSLPTNSFIKPKADLNPAIINGITYTDNSTSFKINIVKDIFAIEDKFGKILHQTNPELFFQLDDKIEISQMIINRAQINSRKSFNRCLVKNMDVQEEMKYETICSVSINNNSIEETVSFRDKLNRIKSIETRFIKPEVDKNYTKNDFTTRELKESKKVCSIKQSKLTFPKITVFDFEDNSVDETSNTKFNYSLEFYIKSNLHDIILEIVNNLRNELNVFNSIINKIKIKKGLNVQTNRFKKDFFIELHNYYDLTIVENNLNLEFFPNDSSNNLNAYWILIPSMVSKLTDFTRGKDDKTYRKIYNLISPLTTSFVKMNKAIELINQEIEHAVLKYDLKSKKSTGKKVTKNLLQNKSRRKVVYNSKKTIFNKKNLNKTKFIKKVNKGVLKKSSLIERGKFEVNKFFINPGNLSVPRFTFLDNPDVNAIADLSENMSYFTPQVISINGNVKELDNNLDSFDLDFFDKVVEMKQKFSPIVSNKVLLSVVDFNDYNVEDYLGNDTLFKNEGNKEIKKMKKINRSFEKNLTANVKDKMTINNFDPDSKDFSFNKIKGKQKTNMLLDLPISIKSIMLGNSDQVSRFPIRNGKFDPLKNPETKESIKQNFTRLKELQILTGYEEVDGFPILNKPLWKKFKKEDLSMSTSLCRLVDYENELLKIKKDKNEIQSINDVFILED